MIPASELASVVDAMLEGLQVLGTDWRYLHLNEAAARHGRRSRDELLGRTIFECFPGIETTAVFAAMQRCMVERISSTLTNVFRFPDGSTGAFELRIAPVPQGICVLSIDVSEHHEAETLQRQADERLAESKRIEAVGLLAAGVAHDFNNYLTLILNHAQSAAARPGGPRAEDLGPIMTAAQSAAELTRELLSSAGRAVVQKEQFDLGPTVLAMAPSLRSLLPERIMLTIDPGIRPHLVHADERQIERVLMNLVRNAGDAIAGPGTIEVSLSAAPAPAAMTHTCPGGDCVVLAVADSGTGVSADARARLFEPFFTTKAQGRGSGLGLATVFGLVKQHQGRLEVSDRVPHGTTIRVWLPRASAAVLVPPPAVPAAKKHESSLAKVLIVDDTPEVAQLIARQLRPAYEVLLATSGEQALEVWRQHGAGIDLVLTDIMLPGMSGWDLVKSFRTNRPGLRVLCMSGYMVVPDSAPADIQYLEKPFTAVQLRAKVQAMLAAATAG